MKVGDELDDGRIVTAPTVQAHSERQCPEVGFKKKCSQIVTKIDCVHYGCHQHVIYDKKTGQPRETTTRFDCAHAMRDLVRNANGVMLTAMAAELRTLRHEYAEVVSVVARMSSPEIGAKIMEGLARGWSRQSDERVAQLVGREELEAPDDLEQQYLVDDET